MMVVAWLLAFALLALLHVLVLADLVRDGATACAYSSADECTFASACKGTDDSATCGRASDDLGAGVFAMVLIGLLPFRTIVRGLRDLMEDSVLLRLERGGEDEKRPECCDCCCAYQMVECHDASILFVCQIRLDSYVYAMAGRAAKDKFGQEAIWLPEVTKFQQCDCYRVTSAGGDWV